MPTSLKDLDRIYRRTYRRVITGAFIIYGASLLVVFSLLFANPKVATWISEATQAEFVGADIPSAPEPLRLAQPARPIQTVKAD